MQYQMYLRSDFHQTFCSCKEWKSIHGAKQMTQNQQINQNNRGPDKSFSETHKMDTHSQKCH